MWIFVSHINAQKRASTEKTALNICVDGMIHPVEVSQPLSSATREQHGRVTSMETIQGPIYSWPSCCCCRCDTSVLSAEYEPSIRDLQRTKQSLVTSWLNQTLGLWAAFPALRHPPAPPRRFSEFLCLSANTFITAQTIWHFNFMSLFQPSFQLLEGRL